MHLMRGNKIRMEVANESLKFAPMIIISGLKNHRVAICVRASRAMLFAP